MNELTLYVSDIGHLIQQWDYDNNQKKPNEVQIGSGDKASWICPKGHKFVKRVSYMAKNNICPECKRISTTVFGKPKMMMFWDSNKNTLDPKMISAKSDEYAWWLCPKCGYNWKSQIRTRKNGLCPCCDTNQKVGRGINDVFTVVPELAKDFKKELNPDIDSGILGVGSHERINWKCHICGFLWTGPIYRRIRYQSDGSIEIGKCPVCAKNRRAIPYVEEYPELKTLFSKDNKCSVYEIKGDPKIKYLWTCEKHGNYPATLRSILRSIKTDNTGCPYCHGSKVYYNESLGAKYPELAKEWSANNKKSAFEILPGSKDNAEWICEKGHSWKAPVYTRVIGYGYCKKCFPFRKDGQGFAEKYPELRTNYDGRNEKPFDVIMVSDKEDRLWRCNYGHEFMLAPVYINHNRTFNCPICNHRIIIPGINDFLTEYPQYAVDYDSKKNVTPVEQASPLSSDPSTWFLCSNNHSFQRAIRNHIASDGVCPVCTKKVLSTGDNDLLTAYPQIKPIWDYVKNDKNPEECVENNYAYYYWTCESKHSYYARVKNLVDNNFKCLVCNNIIIQKGQNDLVTTHPELASEWSDVNDTPPDNYTKESKQAFHWICPICNGDYTARICDRELGDSLCPYCNGNRILKGFNDLLSQKPLLAEEWSSNNERTPDTVTYFSSYEALWICSSCGGEYKKEVKDREYGDDSCPFCNHRKILVGVNDLQTTNPLLAQEWSSNNIKSVTTVMETHAFWAKWICPTCNSEYSAPIRDREVGDDSCPYCNDKRLLSGLNDLATTDPKLANEWSPNNEKKATEVMKSRASYALWICPTCNGEYSAPIRDREVGDDSCPYCNKKRILKGVNDLQTTNPILAKEWSINNIKKVFEVSKNSIKGGYWICPTCNGEYWARLCDRTENDDFCPYCSGKKILAGLNDLQTTDPDLVKEWSKNNPFSPQDIRKHYYVSVKWICPTCNGEYPYLVRDREVGDDSCPYCNDKKILAGLNDLETTDPNLSKEWSVNNDKLASEVMKSYAYQALWICPTCNGEYLFPVRDREVGDDSCPYCNDKKVLVGFNDLETTNSYLANEWSVNNDKKPSDVLKTSAYQALWICPTCNGEYLFPVRDREAGDDSCPYCNDKKILPGFNSFAVKHIDLLDEWDYVNNYLILNPDEIGDKNTTPVWWICQKDKSHHYPMPIERKLMYQKRNRESCPYCKGLRVKKRHFL